jgi:hypothetical protein
MFLISNADYLIMAVCFIDRIIYLIAGIRQNGQSDFRIKMPERVGTRLDSIYRKTTAAYCRHKIASDHFACPVAFTPINNSLL